MKPKQLVFLLIAVVIVVAAGIVLYHRNSRRWSGSPQDSAGRPVVPKLDVNAVARMTISDAANTLTVQRQDGIWQVKEAAGYPADFQKIRQFLLDLKDIKIAQPVEGGTIVHERLKLLEPTGEQIASGVLLRLADAEDRVLHSLILGKQQMRKGGENLPYGGNVPNGRYIRVVESGAIGLVADTFAAATTEKSRWFNREFFKAGRVKTIAMAHHGETLWAFAREKPEDTLAVGGGIPEGKDLDPAAVSQLASAMNYPNFADIAAPDAPPEETGMDAPRVCTITDFDGLQFVISVGAKKGDAFHLRVNVADIGPAERAPVEGEDEEAAKKANEEFAGKLAERRSKVDEYNARLAGWTYLVNSYVVAAIDKSRDDFFKDKPEPAEAPDKPEANDGADPQPTPNE